MNNKAIKLFITITMIMTSCASLTPWHKSIYNGNNDEAKNEILKSKDIDTFNIYGENSLIWASHIGDDDLVVKLLSYGANINVKNKITGETPLVVAVKNGNIRVVNVLLRNNPDVSITDNSGNDAISTAIESGKFELIPVLISAGFTIDDKNKNNMLISAARFGDIKTVKFLIDSKVNVNYQSNNGETALMGAAKSGNVDILRLLVGSGALVDVRDNNSRTALFMATQKGCEECCEALIVVGADINAKDFRGNTPIMWAAIMRNKNLVKLYINKSADLTFKNIANKNALFFSAYDSDIANIILQSNNEITDVIAESENQYDLAMSYLNLGRLLETDLLRTGDNRAILKINIKLTYQYAVKNFDVAVKQYTDLASSLRTKQVLSVLGAALLNAAVQTASVYDSQQKAHQLAELSAVRQGNFKNGVFQGTGPMPNNMPKSFDANVPIPMPNSSNWESARFCDAKADELNKLATFCRNKLNCYDKVDVGQEKSCVN